MTKSRTLMMALMASAILAPAAAIPEVAAAQVARPGAPSNLLPPTPQDPAPLGNCPTEQQLEAYRQQVFNNRQALKAHKARLEAARQAIEAQQRALRPTGQTQAANGLGGHLQQINNAIGATDGMIGHQDDLFDIYWKKKQESEAGRQVICFGPGQKPPTSLMVRSQLQMRQQPSELTIRGPLPATSAPNAAIVATPGLAGALATARRSPTTMTPAPASAYGRYGVETAIR